MRAAARVAETRRVAFLRAINVGGTGLLKMEELRRLAHAAGFRNVSTLGASGNVFYSSARTPAADAKRLSGILAERMGRATVVVRRADEMSRLVGTAPFRTPDPSAPDKWRFVALLEKPSRAPLPPMTDDEALRFDGRAPREVFYTMFEPTRHAIAMAARLERSLGTSMTVRNWNVVRTVERRLRE